jgi:hypothetical protein
MMFSKIFGKTMRKNTIFKQNGDVLRRTSKAPPYSMEKTIQNVGRIGYRVLA